jgi:hypothetical protein
MTLSMYPTVSVPSTVYEEIMGAGGLSRLSDRDVRAAVGEFRAEFDWVQGQNDYFRDLRQDPVKAEDPRVTYSFISTKGDPQVAAYDRGELCNDRGFRNRVIDATRNHWVIVDAQDSLTDWAIKMCVTVGNALHRKCDPPRGGPLSGEDAKLAKRVAAELRGRR